MNWKSILLAMTVFGVTGVPLQVGAMDFWLPNSAGPLDVKVRSMQELRYLETVRQRFDFSCGSAAVATLLSHHYSRQTKEAEVFLSMWKTGDQDKIRRQGFSMLDMKSYLDGLGFQADGFRIPAKRIGEVGVAGVVLLSKLDQPHFVVVSGEKNGELLLSDPARGVWSLHSSELEELWNGIFFAVRGEATLARGNFNDQDLWKHRRWSPVSSEYLATLTIPDALSFPQPGDFNAN